MGHRSTSVGLVHAVEGEAGPHVRGDSLASAIAAPCSSSLPLDMARLFHSVGSLGLRAIAWV
jgi:hypothetical protein